MILKLTDEEIKAYEAIEIAYDKLISAQEKILSRRKDSEPDEAEFRRIQESRIPEPTELKPEPKYYDPNDNMAVYDADELDAYHNSPEYKAFEADNRRANEAISKLYDDWYAAGSDEWKAAKDKIHELENQLAEDRTNYFKSLEEKHFRALGKDPSKILEDAYSQVEQFIINRYYYYDQMKHGDGVSFSARDVRLLDDGIFRLDTRETKINILEVVDRHLKALPDDYKETLLAYIERALSSSPFVSNAGILGGKIAVVKQDETTEKGLTVNRPKKYKYPNTKVNRRLFENELTAEDQSFFTPIDLKGNKKVFTYANFVMPSSTVSAPALDDFDERVYAGLGSCLFAGNNFIPFSTLYNRGMLGLSPKEKNREVSEEAKKDILESLEKFLGQVTIDNDPTGELSAKDPNFKRHIIKESLLFYQIRTEIVHGQLTEGIAIPSGYVPVLYRYAELNREEIITDNIEHIYISGVRYTRDNMRLANATYKRVVEIRYKNDKKRYDREIPENERTIRYDTMAEKAGLDFSTMSPTERNRFKSRLDKYMKSYQNSGLFTRYEHKKDATKSFYAIVIYFSEEVKKIAKK